MVNTLTFAAFLLPGKVLADIFGRRRMSRKEEQAQ